MHGYHNDIENATKQNTDYRRVLYTTRNSQLVLMRLAPGEEIGDEVHKVDQFFRFEAGQGKVVIDGHSYIVGDGDVATVPAGAWHNVVNTSPDKPLTLYTIYSPPNHKDGTVHRTKADETEEHFDGKTTE